MLDTADGDAGGGLEGGRPGVESVFRTNAVTVTFGATRTDGKALSSSPPPPPPPVLEEWGREEGAPTPARSSDNLM